MPPDWSPILAALTLILVANAAPALLGILAGPARAIDGRRVAMDRRPWLGRSKTWRGLAAALLATPLVAMALDAPWWLGLMVAAGAMAGDLLASSLKRRLALASGTSTPLLDQLPESLIPGLLAKGPLGLSWPDLGLVVALFTAIDLMLTPLGKAVGKRLARTWRRARRD